MRDSNVTGTAHTFAMAGGKVRTFKAPKTFSMVGTAPHPYPVSWQCFPCFYVCVNRITQSEGNVIQIWNALRPVHQARWVNTEASIGRGVACW